MILSKRPGSGIVDPAGNDDSDLMVSGMPLNLITAAGNALM
jgi:hypothetical protein